MPKRDQTNLDTALSRLIMFLEAWRTFDEILANEDFLTIAAHFHCTEEDRKKAALHFNWVSARALPDPAVRTWVSERGRHKHRV